MIVSNGGGATELPRDRASQGRVLNLEREVAELGVREDRVDGNGLDVGELVAQRAGLE